MTASNEKKDMHFLDHFSKGSDSYARYRPQYPPELFAYLSTLVKSRGIVWDCATGNGQAAVGLAEYFNLIVASDASTGQLSSAFRHPRILYFSSLAERPALADSSCDLITVAQALHWFKIDSFFEQARRILRPGGAVAVWSYALCRVSPQVDAVIDDFYHNTVGPFWPQQRKIVDDGYENLEFPFQGAATPPLEIRLSWSLDDMLGYLQTWSPRRLYMAARGIDPVTLVIGPLTEAWGPESEREVRWPVTMRAGYAE